MRNIWKGSAIEKHRKALGFTLIELSIVLVIIGFIVGGVLVGRDLVRSASVRAQIAQIDKYNQAVNTFRGKYGALPGDMGPITATNFGFTVGGGCDGSAYGKRNDDGLLDGYSPWATTQGRGEVELFWQDLSKAGLIDGVFPNASLGSASCNGGFSASATTINYILPPAKIGYGASVYVYETSSANWFGLSNMTAVSANGNFSSSIFLPVIDAYNIDRKIDDGLPTTGNVLIYYMNSESYIGSPSSGISGGSPTSCYDTVTNNYSFTYNNGLGANCALSFKLQ